MRYVIFLLEKDTLLSVHFRGVTNPRAKGYSSDGQKENVLKSVVFYQPTLELQNFATGRDYLLSEPTLT